MILEINNPEHYQLSTEEIIEICYEFEKTSIKLNLMNELDINMFGSHLLVTDHEDLIDQFIETSTIWMHYIKLYTMDEEYELCARMMKTYNKMEAKYLQFIVVTEYREEAVNKIKHAKKLSLELLTKLTTNE